MRHNSKLKFLLLLLLAVAGVSAVAAFRGQEQGSPASPALEKAKEDFYTVADFDAPEPSDSQKRALRRLRARRYNLRAEGVDPKRFAMTEQRESSFGRPPIHSPEEPALPAAQSDAVVLGKVVDAQAYLTEDRTSVISEFTIYVSDILKNNPLAPFSVGDSITGNRGGGGVRFPSGKLIQRGQHGKPLPRVGRQYLLFLRHVSDGGGDYEIITAYEVRGGRVYPLDGLSLVNTVQPAYAAYQKYKDADEATFLNDVRDAIARSLRSAKTA